MEEWFGGRGRGAVASSVAPGLWRLVAEAMCVAAGYALIAVVLLHPWFSDPGRSVASLSPGAGGIEVADVNLVMWILSWDWHALTTNPLGLFDANIFHPAPNALAASEHLLGQVAIFGPMYAWSGNPVLAYQFNFLANVALSGAGLYALVRHWGVSPTGAFFGGLIYAFLPFRLQTANYPHLFAGQYAPIALLFLDRTLLRARAWDAVAFCLALLMQMLCSYYLAYITSVTIAAYVAGVCWAGRRRIVVRGALLAMAGAGVAVGIFAFFSIPYVQLRSAGAIPDATEIHWLRIFSARPWWAFLKPGSHFYLGFIPMLLALAGLARSPRVAPRVPWVRASAVCVAVGCSVMALGPELPLGAWTIPLPYQAAMDFVPGFSSMRAPRRFVLMGALGFAALAGIGLSAVVLQARRRFGRALAIAIALVVFVGTAAEFGMLATPHRVRRVRSGGVAPEVYGVLATAPCGPVLEIPSNRFDGHFRGALDVSEYMFYSTIHWNPLIDGYSGYVPPSAYVTRALVAALPSEKALSLLRRTTGLRYVIVHRNHLSPAAVREWENPPGLRPLRALSFGAAVLFEVIDPAEPDLVPELIRLEPRSTTMLGLPLAPLQDDDMRAEIHVRAKELGVLSFYPVPIDVLVERDATVIAGFPITVDVTITNESNAAWPSLATVADHLVTVGYRWEAMDGSVLVEDQLASRLAYDLAPGESVRQRLAVFTPTAGEARLVVGLVQGGRWFPSVAEPIPFTVQSGSTLEIFLPGRGTVPTDA